MFLLLLILGLDLLFFRPWLKFLPDFITFCHEISGSQTNRTTIWPQIWSMFKTSPSVWRNSSILSIDPHSWRVKAMFGLWSRPLTTLSAFVHSLSDREEEPKSWNNSSTFSYFTEWASTSSHNKGGLLRWKLIFLICEMWNNFTPSAAV